MTDRVVGEDLEDAAEGLPMPPSRGEGDGEVTVVGTAHVSHESVERVEQTIEEERPDVVAVELDEGRYRQMQGETPDDLEPSDLLGGNTVFQFLAYWMLSYVQTRLGDRFDIDPGADMMAAVDTAKELGLGVALVDRDIQTTIQRFWTRLTLLERLKLVSQLSLAAGPPSIVGLALGASFGLFLGFGAASVAAGSLGIASADFLAMLGSDVVGAVGGLVGGAVLGLVLWALLDPTLRNVLDATPLPNTPLARAADSVVLGVVAGLGLALGGGFSFGPLALSSDRFVSLGGFALQSGTGMAAGALALGSVGAALGLVVERSIPEANEDIDEFDIEAMTDADVVTAMMEEFRRFSPGGAEALIDERDAFIAHRLVALREAGYDVVAVVGAGHRAGIEGYLANPASLPPMEDLVGKERGRGLPWKKAIGYAITVGFVGFFVLLALAGVENAFLFRLFGAWFLINGAFAFAFAKLAGARWTSAGVGGAVAWMTSINPMLAPGWFTGYVELRSLTVNVGDIGRLNELLSDETQSPSELVSAMLDVPLFKLIVVVAMTNIGSIVASFLFAVYVIPAMFGDVGGVDEVGRLMIEGASTGAEFLRTLITGGA